MHQVEGLVDLGEPELVRDQVVDVDLALHVPVDDLRPLGAASRTAEGRALPHAAGHQLERPRLDLLASARDADDHRHAPAAMAALEGLAHELDVADALEAVVGAAAGELDQLGDEVAFNLLRIHEVREAELARQRFARRIDIDADDQVRADQLRALHHVEPDASQAEHHHAGARLYPGGIDHRADAGRHAAADVAHLV